MRPGRSLAAVLPRTRPAVSGGPNVSSRIGLRPVEQARVGDGEYEDDDEQHHGRGRPEPEVECLSEALLVDVEGQVLGRVAGPPACQAVDDVKRLQRLDSAQNQYDHDRRPQERHGDREELTDWPGTVDAGRLIQVPGNALQTRQQYEG